MAADAGHDGSSDNHAYVINVSEKEAGPEVSGWVTKKRLFVPADTQKLTCTFTKLGYSVHIKYVRDKDELLDLLDESK